MGASTPHGDPVELGINCIVQTRKLRLREAETCPRYPASKLQSRNLNPDAMVYFMCNPTGLRAAQMAGQIWFQGVLVRESLEETGFGIGRLSRDPLPSVGRCHTRQSSTQLVSGRARCHREARQSGKQEV